MAELKNTITVKLDCGEIVLKKPKAGVRNKAMQTAETKDGISQITMMMTLLPFCIQSHPWGLTKVGLALDDLEFEEYDLLIDGLRKLVNPEKGDAEKKSD